MSELRRNIQINGETYHLAVNQYGSGAPGSTTPGKPGVLYMDTENGELYKCRTADAKNKVYGWEKIGTGSVGSWNDLTDKPFVPEKVYYEWDEDTEYTTVVPSLEGMAFTQLARISEDAPPSDFFLGKSVDVHGIDETGNFHSVVLLRIGAIQQYSANVYVISGGAMAFYVCTGTSANLEGMTITKGIWCMDGWKEPLFDLIITEMRLIDPAVTLDESVIPDTIARTNEIPNNLVTSVNGIIPDENGNVELSDGYEWHEVKLYGISTVYIANVPEKESIADWDGLMEVSDPDYAEYKAIDTILDLINAIFTQGIASTNSNVLEFCGYIAQSYLAIREAGIFGDSVFFVTGKNIIRKYDLLYNTTKNALTIIEYLADGTVNQIIYDVTSGTIISESIDHSFRWTKKYVDEAKMPIPETASVGQTIVVKAVDENGKPTEWEAVDLPAGGTTVTDEHINDLIDAKLGVIENGTY